VLFRNSVLENFGAFWNTAFHDFWPFHCFFSVTVVAVGVRLEMSAELSTAYYYSRINGRSQVLFSENTEGLVKIDHPTP
jgi:hypothetical protein